MQQLAAGLRLRFAHFRHLAGHACGTRVDAFHKADEIDAERLQFLEQRDQVLEIPAQSIEAPADQDVEPTAPSISHKLVERGPRADAHDPRGPVARDKMSLAMLAGAREVTEREFSDFQNSRKDPIGWHRKGVWHDCLVRWAHIEGPATDVLSLRSARGPTRA